MTPYDLMLWSIAGVVVLVCTLAALMVIKAIFITLLSDGDEDGKHENSEDGDNPKGVRRIK